MLTLWVVYAYGGDVLEFISLSLPKPLVERVRRRIQEDGTYPSIASFVAEAVRRRLEELERGEVMG